MISRSSYSLGKRITTGFMILCMLVTYMPQMTYADIIEPQSTKTEPIVILKAQAKKKSVKLSWLETDSAEKYLICGSKCGKASVKLKSNYKGTSFTVKKIGKKKLKKKTHYKFYVVAYDSHGDKIAKSLPVHVITGNTRGKYANAKVIRTDNTKLTLAKNDSESISPKSVNYGEKKSFPSSHVKKYRYISSATSVATVDSHGVVTGKSRGEAIIYTQAANGLYCKTKVIVTNGKPCTVTFDSNGGSGTMVEQTFTIGEEEGIQANAFTAPSGKVFDSWNTKKDGSGTHYDDKDAAIFREDTTLYAMWKVAGSGDEGGTDGGGGGGGGGSGGGGGDNDPQSDEPKVEYYAVLFHMVRTDCGQDFTLNVKPGGKVVKPANPKTPLSVGLVFAGWYKEPEYINEWKFDEDVVKDNTDLYARWLDELDLAKKEAIEYIEKIAGPEEDRSDELQDIVDEYSDKIQNAESKGEIEDLVSEAEDAIKDQLTEESNPLAIQKATDIAAIEAAAGDPDGRSEQLQNLVDIAEKAINEAETLEDVSSKFVYYINKITNMLKDEAGLSAARSAAVAALEKAAGDPRSDAMQAAIDAARKEIAKAETEPELSEALKEGLDDIADIKASERFEANKETAIETINTIAGDNPSKEVEKLVASAEAAINKLSVNEEAEYNGQVAALDTLVDAYIQKILAQEEKDATDYYSEKQFAKEAIEATAGNEDTRSDAVQKLVASAEAEIDDANNPTEIQQIVNKYIKLIEKQLEKEAVDPVATAKEGALAAIEEAAGNPDKRSEELKTVVEAARGLINDPETNSVEKVIEKLKEGIDKINAQLSKEELARAKDSAKATLEAAAASADASEEVLRLLAEGKEQIDQQSDIPSVNDVLIEYLDYIKNQKAHENTGLKEAQQQAKEAISAAASKIASGESRYEEVQDLKDTAFRIIDGDDTIEKVNEDLQTYLDKIIQEIFDGKGLDKGREAAKEAVEAAAGDPEQRSDEMSELVEEAIRALDKAKTTTDVKEKMDYYLDEIADLRASEELEKEKERAINTIESAADDPEFRSEEMQKLVDNAETLINKSDTPDEVQEVVDRYIKLITELKEKESQNLDGEKELAKETVKAAGGDDPSEAVQAIMDEAYGNIDDATSSGEIQLAVKLALEKILNQRSEETSAGAAEDPNYALDQVRKHAKEALETAATGYPDNCSEEMKSIVGIGENRIDYFTSDVDEVITELQKALEAVQEQKVKDELKNKKERAKQIVYDAAGGTASELSDATLKDIVSRADAAIEVATGDAAVDRAMTKAIEEISRYNKEVASGDAKEDLAAAIKEAIETIETIAGDPAGRSEGLQTLVDIAENAIEDAQGVDEVERLYLYYITRITNALRDEAGLAAARSAAVAAIEKEAGPEASRSDAMQAAVDAAKKEIAKAETEPALTGALKDGIQDITDIKASERFERDKKEAIDTIKTVAGNNPSSKVAELVASAEAQIGLLNVDKEEEYVSILNTLNEKVDAYIQLILSQVSSDADEYYSEKQFAKEAIEVAAGDPDNRSDEVQKLVTSAEAEIDKASDSDEIDKVLEEYLEEIAKQLAKESTNPVATAKEGALAAIEEAAGPKDKRSDELKEKVKAARDAINAVPNEEPAGTVNPNGVKAVIDALKEGVDNINKQLEKEEFDRAKKSAKETLDAAASGNAEALSIANEGKSKISDLNYPEKTVADVNETLTEYLERIWQAKKDNDHSLEDAKAQAKASISEAASIIASGEAGYEEVQKLKEDAFKDIDKDNTIEDVNEDLQDYLEQIIETINENAGLEKGKESAKIAIEKAAGYPDCSDEMKELVDTAERAIDKSETITDLEEKLDYYLDEIADLHAAEELDKEKERAIDTIEAAADDAAFRSDEMQGLVDTAEELINKSDSKDEIQDVLVRYIELIKNLKDIEASADSEENLDGERALAKATVTAAGGDNPSTEVQRIINRAHTAIDDAKNLEGIQNAVDWALEEILKQRAEETSAGAADNPTYALDQIKKQAKETLESVAGPIDEWSEELQNTVRGIINTGKTAIDAVITTPEDVAKALHEALQKIQEQRTKDDLLKRRVRAKQIIEDAAGEKPYPDGLDVIVASAEGKIEIAETSALVDKAMIDGLAAIAEFKKENAEDSSAKALADAIAEAMAAIGAASGYPNCSPEMSLIVISAEADLSDDKTTAEVNDTLKYWLGEIIKYISSHASENAQEQDIDSVRQAALAALVAAGGTNPSDEVIKIINEGKEMINLAETTPDIILQLNDYINQISKQLEKERLQSEKESSKAIIDRAAGDEEFRSKKMRDLVSSAEAAIDDSETIDGLRLVLNEYLEKIRVQAAKDAELAEARAAAKEVLDTVLDEEKPSAEMKAIVDAAKEMIDSVEDFDAITAEMKEGIYDIVEQKDKEEGGIDAAQDSACTAIDEVIGQNPSAAMVELCKEAKDQINGEDDVNIIIDILKYYFGEIDELKRKEASAAAELSAAQKEAIKAIEDEAGYPVEDRTAEMQKRVDFYEKQIEEAETPEEVTEIKDIALSNIKDQHSKEKIIVQFETRGHGGEVKSQEFEKEGGYLEKPTLASADGYRFVGWYTTPSCADYSYFTFKEKVVKSMTLYAKWEAYQYTVYFDKNDVSASGTMEPRKYFYDQVDRLPLNQFELLGKTFGGWALTASGEAVYTNGAMIYNLCSDLSSNSVTLYAVWTNDEKIMIFYEANDPTWGTVDPTSETIAKETTANGSTAIANPGYKFSHWEDEHHNPLSSDANNHFTPQKVEGVFKSARYTAVFEPITYHVHFEPNAYAMSSDGKVYIDPALSENASVSGEMTDMDYKYEEWKRLSRNNFKRDNWEFLGWNTSADGSGDFYEDRESVHNLSTSDDATVTLYAQWGRESYTVNFDMQHKGVQVKPQNVKAGDKAKEPAIPTCEGYTFVGWYTEPDISGDATDDAVAIILSSDGKTKMPPVPAEQYLFNFDREINNDYTLYAHWRANKYTINFEKIVPTNDASADASAGAEVSGNMPAMNMRYNQKSQLTKNAFTRENWKFDGWKDASSSGTYTDEAWVDNLREKDDSSITLQAKWKRDVYTVRFDMLHHGVSVEEQSVNSGDYAERPEVPTETGYTFVGWYTVPNVTGDTTADAKATIVSGGATRVVSAEPYRFDFENTQIKENKVLYAHWRVNKYRIKFTRYDEDGSHIDGIDVEQEFEYGEHKKLAAAKTMPGVTELENHTFVGWTYNGELYRDGDSIMNLTASDGEVLEFRATFNEDRYTVTFELNGHGDTVPDQITDVMSGTKLSQADKKTVTATGYKFIGWYKDPTGKKAWIFDGDDTLETPDVVRSDVTLYAKWVAIPYTIVFNKNINGGDDTEDITGQDINVLYDDAVNLTPALTLGIGTTITKPDNRFIGWSEEKTDTTASYADGTSVFNLCSNPIADQTNIVRLYAVWGDKDASVIHYRTANAEYGTVNPVSEIVGGAGGKTAADGSVPSANPGYVFDKWVFDDDNSIDLSANGWVNPNTHKLTPLKEINGRSEWQDASYTAYFKGAEYNIVFHKNAVGSNDVTHIQAATFGEYINLDKFNTITENNFKNSGYAFAGWSIVSGDDKPIKFSDGETVYNLTTEVGGLYHLYAQWTRINHVVTFDVQNHGLTVPAVVVAENAHVSKPTAPSEEGYTFLGWFTEPDGGIEWEFNDANDNEVITKDITLYAHWTPNKYTVNYHGNGADASSGAMSSDSFTYDKAGEHLSKNTYYRTGYRFGGWINAPTMNEASEIYSDCAPVYNLRSASGDAIDLYAYWVPVSKMPIFYESADLTKGYVVPTVEVIVSTADANGAIARNSAVGYKCDYWTDMYGNIVWSSADASNDADFVATGKDKWLFDRSHYRPTKFYDNSVTENMTNIYTAHWVGVDYKVNFHANEEGSGDAMESVWMVYDTPENLPKCTYFHKDNIPHGKVFAGWNTEEDGTGIGFKDEQEVKNLLSADGEEIDLYAQWRYPTGGKIFYVHDVKDDTEYKFYDQYGKLIETKEQTVKTLANAMYYDVDDKVGQEKFYVVATKDGDPANEILITYSNAGGWDADDQQKRVTPSAEALGVGIGTGKMNTKTMLAEISSNPIYKNVYYIWGSDGATSTWKKLIDDYINASMNKCNDWFVGSPEEIKQCVKTCTIPLAGENTGIRYGMIWSSEQHTTNTQFQAGVATTAFKEGRDVYSKGDIGFWNRGNKGYWNAEYDGYTDKSIMYGFVAFRTLGGSPATQKCNIIFNRNVSNFVGGISRDDEIQTCYQGQQIALRANTFDAPSKKDGTSHEDEEGKVFAGWNTKKDGTGTSYANQQIITADADMTLYAQWHFPVGGKIYHDLSGNEQFTGSDVNVDYTFYDKNGAQINNWEVSGGALAKAAYYDIGVDQRDNIVTGRFLVVATVSADPEADILTPAQGLEWGAYNVQTELGTDRTINRKIGSSALVCEEALAPEMYSKATSKTTSGDSIWTWIKGLRQQALYDCSDWSIPTINELLPLGETSNNYWTCQESSNEGEYNKAILKNASGTTWENSKNVVDKTEKNKTVAVRMLSPNSSSNVYTIKYKANNGSGSVITERVVVGDTIVIKSIDETEFTGPDDQIFIGWNTSIDGIRQPYYPGQKVKLTENLNLYAQWGTKAYTVEFDLNGLGDYQSSIDDQVVGENCKAQEPMPPTAAGFTFLGWYTNPKCEDDDKWDFDKDVVTKNMTLFAKWSGNTYTVKFDANGGSGNTMADQQIAYGEKTRLFKNKFNAPAPTSDMPGYEKVFAGWNTRKDGRGDNLADGQQVLNLVNSYDFDDEDTSKQTVTLYAQWHYPVGGRIYYVDTTKNDNAVYQFYDENGDLIQGIDTENVADLEYATYYEVIKGTPKYDKYYVFATDANKGTAILSPACQWGAYKHEINARKIFSDTTGSLGKGEEYSLRALAAPNYQFTSMAGAGENDATSGTIWTYMKDIRDSKLNGCDDWYIGSTADYRVRLADTKYAKDDQGRTLFVWNPNGADPNLSTYSIYSSIEHDAGNDQVSKQQANAFIPTASGSRPEDPGYHVDGWYYQNKTIAGRVLPIRKFGGPELEVVVSGESVDIHESESNTVKITFDINDAVEKNNQPQMAQQIVKKDEDFVLNANEYVAPGNAVFVGWNTSADGIHGTQYSDKSVANFTEDTTLYAQWALGGDYQIRFDQNNGPTLSGEALTENPQTFKFGRDIELNKNTKLYDPEKGLAFVGWNTRADGKGTFYANEAKVRDIAAKGQTLVLYAQWHYAVGGRIFYVDPRDDGAKYTFYDETGFELDYIDKEDINDLADVVYYEVEGTPKFDKYYVVATEDGKPDGCALKSEAVEWGANGHPTNVKDSAVGTGKSNTSKLLDSALYEFTSKAGQNCDQNAMTAWRYIKENMRASHKNNCSDWYVGTEDEYQELKTSGLAKAPNGTYFTTSVQLFLFTSTEVDSTTARSYNYANGFEAANKFDSTTTIIPIRSFGSGSGAENAQPYNESDVKTIKFDKNGGTGTMKDQIVASGEPTALNANEFVAPTGMIFTGWNTEANGSGTAYADRQTVTLTTVNELKLYAQYADINSVVITYLNDEPEMGTVSTAYEAINPMSGVVQGSKATAKEGYKFTGWTLSNGTEISASAWLQDGGAKLVPQKVGDPAKFEGKTYVAHFEPITYNVVFYASADSTETSSCAVKYDEKLAAPSCMFKRDNYKFLGWSIDPNGARLQRIDYPVGKSIYKAVKTDGDTYKLYASWTEEEHTISFDLQGGKTNRVLDSTASYNHAAMTLPTANDVSKTGYTFSGWSEYPGGSSVGLTYNYHKDVTLYAMWTAKTYTIKYVGEDNTGGSMADTTGVKYDEPTALRANTFTKKGYKFAGWTTVDDGTSVQYGDQEKVLNLCTGASGDDSVTLHAVWVEEDYVVITYLTDDPTMGTVSKASETVNPISGSVEGSTATAKTGYKFTGWTLADGVTVVTGTAELSGTNNETIKPKQTGTPAKYSEVTYLANFEPIEYMIRFDGNNSTSGSTADITGIKYDDKVSLPECGFEKTGYTFTGWKKTMVDAASVTDNTIYPPGTPVSKLSSTNYSSGSTGIVVFTAQWTKNNYTVSFDTNGHGNNSVESKTVAYEDRIAASPTVSATGYTFDGWYDKPTDGTKFVFSATTGTQVKSDITLYAHWTANTYTIKFDAEGGTGNTSNVSATYDTPTALTANGFTKTGYKFAGWTTVNDGTSVQYGDQEKVLNLCTGASGDDSVTLHAVWTEETNVVITYRNANPDMGTLTRASETLNPSVANKAQGSQAKAKTGYHFVDWTMVDETTAVSNTATLSTTTENNDTVTPKQTGTPGKYSEATYVAHFAPNEHSILFSDDGDQGSPTTTTISNVKYGEKVSLPVSAASKTGYVFVGWNTQQNLAGTTYKPGAPYTMGDANVTLYGMWVEDTFTVHFNFNGHGEGSVDAQSQTVKYNSPVALTSPTATGYIFKGWSETANGSTVYTNSYTVKKNVTLYAIWEAMTYTVVYKQASGAQIDSESFTYDQYYTLKAGTVATTPPGKKFVAWTADANGSSSQYISGQRVKNLYTGNWSATTRTVTLTATFDDESLLIITYLSEDIDKGTVSPTYTTHVAHASSTATAKAGYKFAGWYGSDGIQVSTSATLTPQKDGNGNYKPETYTARFEGRPFNLQFNKNDGSGTVEKQSVKYGESDSLKVFKSMSGMDRTGYTFVGWNTAADGTGTPYVDGQTVDTKKFITSAPTTDSQDGDKVLYAQWNQNKYAVNFEMNGHGYGTTTFTNGLYEHGRTFTLTDNKPTETGYIFDGWYTDSDYTYKAADSYQVTAPVTFYAKWTPITYGIIYHKTSSDAGIKENSYKYDQYYALKTCDDLGVVAGSFTRFSNWNTEKDGKGTSFIDGQQIINLVSTNNGTIDLWPQFVENKIVTYLYEVKVPGTGTLDKNIENGGSSATGVTATPESGYEFYKVWNQEGKDAADAGLVDVTGPDANGVVKIVPKESVSDKFIIEFTGKEYTIKFDGGSISKSWSSHDKQLRYGEATSNGFTQSELTDTASGKVVISWNTKADGTGTSYSVNEKIKDVIVPTATLNTATLYAQWAYPVGGRIYYVNKDSNVGDYVFYDKNGNRTEDISKAAYYQPNGFATTPKYLVYKTKDGMPDGEPDYMAASQLWDGTTKYDTGCGLGDGKHNTSVAGLSGVPTGYFVGSREEIAALVKSGLIPDLETWTSSQIMNISAYGVQNNIMNNGGVAIIINELKTLPIKYLNDPAVADSEVMTVHFRPAPTGSQGISGSMSTILSNSSSIKVPDNEGFTVNGSDNDTLVGWATTLNNAKGGTVEYKVGDSISYAAGETVLYAVWKSKPTHVTIYHMTQNLDKSTYSVRDIETKDANVYMTSGEFNSFANNCKKTYTGFTHNEAKMSDGVNVNIGNNQSISLNSDGSSKLYFYYDRESMPVTLAGASDPDVTYNYDRGVDTIGAVYGEQISLEPYFATNSNGDKNQYWETSKGEVIRNNTYTVLESGIRVYPRFDVETYSLRFVLNGGEVTSTSTSYTGSGIEDKELTRGSTLHNPTKDGSYTVERKGYDLEGWYTVNDRWYPEDKWEFETTTGTGTKIMKDTVLYAHWVPKEYFIELSGNGADSGSMNMVRTEWDEMVILPKNTYKRDGYTFAGWGTNMTDVAYVDQCPVKNVWNLGGMSSVHIVTLYAIWEENPPIVITYNVASTSQGSLDRQIEYVLPVSGNVLGSTPTPAMFYEFDHWENSKGETLTDGVLLDGTLKPQKKNGVYKSDSYTAYFKPIS